MKINKQYVVEDGPQNRLLLALLLCTVMSPILPGICLAAIAGLALWKYRWSLCDRDLVSIALLGLAGVAVIATIVQQTMWGFVSILAFLIYFAVYGWMKREVTVRDFDRGLTFASVAGVGIIVVMLIEQWGGFAFMPDAVGYFFGLDSWKPTESLRSTGTSGNANLAASLLVALALVAFYKLLSPGQTVQAKILWTGVAGSYLVGIALTETRMAWIALSFGLAVQFVFVYGERVRREMKRLHVSHYVVGLIACGIFLAANADLLPRHDSLGSDMLLRFEIWERALRIFNDNWLVGVLPLHFGEVFLHEFGVYEFHAHNMFIGIAVDFGIVGFCLFMLLFVSAVVRGIQWFAMADNARDKGLAIVLLSIVASYVGQGFADYTILVPQTGWLFITSLAFMHIRWLQLAPHKQAKAAKRKMAHVAQAFHLIPK
ncbi:O-antigen ligase family protein [Numidum massiliense]|uniref:O-antigen ligase family protein n=1 Tax=Numidum massiliense TaxID=1522315 RepID=UPI0006D5A9E6|nr:O-antigen ligase family protein [Numidum massiliense]